MEVRPLEFFFKLLSSCILLSLPPFLKYVYTCNAAFFNSHLFPDMALVRVTSAFLVVEASGGVDGDDFLYSTLFSVFDDADRSSLKTFLLSYPLGSVKSCADDHEGSESLPSFQDNELADTVS